MSPVLTSTAHAPQLPSMMASASSGFSRQYRTCWPAFAEVTRSRYGATTNTDSGAAACTATWRSKVTSRPRCRSASRTRYASITC